MNINKNIVHVKTIEEMIQEEIQDQAKLYNKLLDEYTGVVSSSVDTSVNLSGHTIESLKQVSSRYRTAIEQIQKTLHEERKQKTQQDIDVLASYGLHVKEKFNKESDVIEYYISYGNIGANFHISKKQTLIEFLFEHVLEDSAFLEWMLWSESESRETLNQFNVMNIIEAHKNIKKSLKKIKEIKECKENDLSSF